MADETRQADEPNMSRKKRYSAPRLTDYGSVSQLTMGGTLAGNDGNTKCTSGDAATQQCDGPPVS